MAKERSLEQLCRDFLDDRLPPDQRKQVEQRIANGDQELISVLSRMRTFEDPARKSDASPQSETPSEKRLEDYLEPNQEADDGGPVSDAKPKSQPAGSDDNQSDGEEKPMPAFLTESSEKERFRSGMLKAAGFFIGFLVLYLAYVQWSNVNLENNLEITRKQYESAEKQLDQLDRSYRVQKQRFNQLKSIMAGKLVEHIPFEDSGLIKKGVILWDRSTFRMAMMFPEATLPAKNAFYFWVLNRDREWNRLGTITSMKSDSLYLDWNSASLARARSIAVRIDSLKPASDAMTKPEAGRLVTTIRMPG